MARPQRPWFRFYTETISDRKLRRLKPAQRWLWAAVMAAARESPIPGTLLDGAEDTPMTTRSLADYAGMTDRDVRATMPEFERAEMIHHDAAGAWVVTNFRRRQFESDNVTARTRKHREKEPDPPDRNVPIPFPGTTKGTANGSSQERSPSRALTTESESETDPLSSSDSFQRAVPGPDDEDQDQAGQHQVEHPPDPDHQHADQGNLDQLIDQALAIVVDRDLDARQQNPQLTPIGDVEAWKRRATEKRIERGTRAALVDLARLDPQAGPEQLADALEPPAEPPAERTNGAATDPLAGQREALLERARIDQQNLRAILQEPPVAPDVVAKAIADARRAAEQPGAEPA